VKTVSHLSTMIIGHMLSTMVIGNMREDARTSYLGYENVLHGCRLGVSI